MKTHTIHMTDAEATAVLDALDIQLDQFTDDISDYGLDESEIDRARGMRLVCDTYDEIATSLGLEQVNSSAFRQIIDRTLKGLK